MVFILRTLFVSGSIIILLVKILLEMIIAIGISYIVILNKGERTHVNQITKEFIKKNVK